MNGNSNGRFGIIVGGVVALIAAIFILSGGELGAEARRRGRVRARSPTPVPSPSSSRAATSSSRSSRRMRRSSSPSRCRRSPASSSTRTRCRPATAARVGATVERFVDGGIVGGPPAPRLYLSGAEAPAVGELFAGSPVETLVVGNASALKMRLRRRGRRARARFCSRFAQFARAEGIWEPLAEEWERSQPELRPLAWRLRALRRRRAGAGSARWRRSRPSLEADGLPPGFHEAAADVYRGS